MWFFWYYIISLIIDWFNILYRYCMLISKTPEILLGGGSKGRLSTPVVLPFPPSRSAPSWSLTFKHNFCSFVWHIWNSSAGFVGGPEIFQVILLWNPQKNIWAHFKISAIKLKRFKVIHNSVHSITKVYIKIYLFKMRNLFQAPNYFVHKINL